MVCVILRLEIYTGYGLKNGSKREAVYTLISPNNKGAFPCLSVLHIGIECSSASQTKPLSGPPSYLSLLDPPSIVFHLFLFEVGKKEVNESTVR